ncbi:SDR family NAD(P)-dependent oxidoreductase [Streptomyces sp. B3I8]|uniref:SDR family NAD(P)-dependent oxidoreductase n=1 Tax=Streptomyces sp. B3I8 TaxID=3042303 RepID=UPI00278A4529|nr:SDR family NAD(P)-dependent oxidoreductase [Streptomyces sp. B3I8]MDQ0786866.1 NAD(P)-dependent dehydrogenase (short-subunit alcohol dehydrogenase family) [Streptomyces sp. B3I8]
MTHHLENQQPLGSGFTAFSTAAEVLTGVDLTDRNIVLTGGHSGLGLASTEALVKAGASVTVAARDTDAAAAALAGIDGVRVERLDLLDPESIDAFAARWTHSGRPLHVLINNAAATHRQRVLDARGYETTFATAFLGHFQLTLGLLPALRAAHGARVVNVASGSHRLSDIRWDDLHFAHGYDSDLAYGQSKTALILFAGELDRRWAADGIRGYSLHPGISVITSLRRASTSLYAPAELRAMGLIGEDDEPVLDPEREKKTPEQAAATIAFAAASPLLDGIGGVYLKNSDVARVDARPLTPEMLAVGDVTSDLAPHAADPASAHRLWDLAERLLTK